MRAEKFMVKKPGVEKFSVETSYNLLLRAGENIWTPDFRPSAWEIHGWKVHGWSFIAEKFKAEKVMVEKVIVEEFMVEEFMVEKSGVKAWHWKVRGWNVLQLYEKHAICNGRKRKFLFKIENFKSNVYEWKIGTNGHDVV